MTTVNISDVMPQVPSEQVNISINITTTLNISAFAARQKVNGLVLSEVGTGIGGDPPSLVIEQQRLLWRVPLFLALPSKGRIGQVGSIDVDAHSGEVLADAKTLKDIGDHAERLAAGSGV
jgi:hypothetical protein